MVATDTYMPIKNIDTKNGVSYLYTKQDGRCRYLHACQNIDTKTGVSYGGERQS